MVLNICLVWTNSEQHSKD